MKNNSTAHNVAMLAGAIVLLVSGLGIGYALANGKGETQATNTDSAVTVSSLASKASATEHNSADVMFAQMMVPHHQQALEMAKLAPERASSPEVKALASKIEAAQQPEIDTMTTWINAWGSDEMAMDHSAHMSMNGMMSEQDMTDLEKLSGTAFDKAFLEMMIEHHTGAIDMAETELKDGQNADALALASSIQVTQQAEVAQMRTLQK